MDDEEGRFCVFFAFPVIMACMEWGRNFGFIDVESFVFIGEDVVVGRIIWGE